MAVINLPSKVQFSKVDKLQLLRAGATLRSRYTAKRQAVSFPFACWVFEGTLLPMDGLDAGQWRSFLVKLDGLVNSFRLPVPGSSKPLSGYAGNLTVGGSGVFPRGKIIPVTGPANTLVLRDGDYFNIGDELKIATADVTIGSGGTANVPCMPAVRGTYSAGTQVKLQDPFIYLAAALPDQASWSLERPVRHGIKLTCVEAI